MNQESINNLQHIEKVLNLELEKIIKYSDKDKAYHDFYINICKLIQLTQQNIDIASQPDKYLKLMRLSNPDDKKK